MIIQLANRKVSVFNEANNLIDLSFCMRGIDPSFIEEYNEGSDFVKDAYADADWMNTFTCKDGLECYVLYNYLFDENETLISIVSYEPERLINEKEMTWMVRKAANQFYADKKRW